MEATERNASLNDEIARKIDKKPVLCFLKDYDRSFESRFERTFPVVKLYDEEEVNSTKKKKQEPSTLFAEAAIPTLQDCASVTIEKEKQLFSPSTKSEVEEIATTVGIDQGTPLSSAVVKRGIIFGESSAETEHALVCEKVPSPTHETIVPLSSSEQ